MGLDGLTNASIYAFYTYNIDIFCINGNCNNVLLYADKAINATVHCETTMDAAGGCTDLDISTEDISGTVEVLCIGPYSCIGGAVKAGNATSVNMIFESDINVSQTAEPITIHTSDFTNSTNIFCRDYGCYYLDLWLFNDLNDINIIWNGNCSCDSLSECIDEWTLYCNKDAKIPSKYKLNGTTCSKVKGNQACCNSNNIVKLNKTFNKYWNDLGECRYVTPAPTHKDNGFTELDWILLAAGGGGILLLILIATGINCILKKRGKKGLKSKLSQAEYSQIN